MIPCFNYGRFLRAAIDSALAQRRDDAEVLVIDDASTDDTQQIVASYGDRIRYVRNEKNLGAGGAWKRGLELAAGEFVIKLDADDELLPGHHDAVEQAFRANPAAAMVMASVRLRDERSGNEQDEFVCDRDTRLAADEFRRRLLRDFFFRMPGCALRRACLEGHEGPDPELFQIHDWEYFLRVCKGGEAMLIHRPLAVYRIHDSSISAVARSEQRLFHDVDRWLEIAKRPGERQLSPDDRGVLRGSLAIQLVTGFGSQAAAGRMRRFARAWLQACKVALAGGPAPLARLHGALVGKAVRRLSRPGRRS
ncbi:MAG: glycosyltransferase [Xanthomonadales bacterium]|nr:glycosyltransferase [Xanthomonadales bacterium]